MKVDIEKIGILGWCAFSMRIYSELPFTFTDGDFELALQTCGYGGRAFKKTLEIWSELGVITLLPDGTYEKCPVWDEEIDELL